jgi:hypothetical protein
MVSETKKHLKWTQILQNYSMYSEMDWEKKAATGVAILIDDTLHNYPMSNRKKMNRKEKGCLPTYNNLKIIYLLKLFM